MCGIVAILGRHEVAPLHPRGAEAARVPRLRQRRHRHRARRPARAPPRRRQARSRSPTCWCRTRSAAMPASATPAGRPTAQPSERNAHPHQAGRRRGRAQRHHRELPRAARRARGRGRGLRDRDRHRDRRPALQPRARARASRRSRRRARRSRGSQGAFALCFLFDGEDDLLVAARRGSPLAVGYGDGEIFVGSDALALAPLHQPHRLSRGGRPRGADPRRASRSSTPAARAGRARGPPRPGGELLRREGPLQALHGEGDARAADGDRRRARALPRARTASAVALPAGDRLRRRRPRWCSSPAARRTTPATSRNTGSSGSRGCRSRSRSPREFRYREPPLGPGALGIFVSQSGETADTLAALRYVRGAGRAHRLGRQRRDLDDGARERRGAADPRRARRSASPRPRPSPASSPCSRRWRSSPARQRGRLDAGRGGAARRARSAEAPGLVARALALEPQIAEMARDLRAGARRALPRPRADVSAGAGRRAEAQGDQLHPRRRLCGGRDEARADRADRRGRAGDRARALRRALRQDRHRTCRR